MSRKIIKWMINISGAILIGSAVLAIRKQITVSKAHKIREHQRRYGSDFELSEEKQQILKEADEYLDNHVGRKLASMMRTEEFYAHQIEKKLREKEGVLSTLSEDEKQKIEELKDEIAQLNRVYVAVKPKRITSWQQLREKDEEQEGY